MPRPASSPARFASLHAARTAVRQRWSLLAPRERTLVAGAAVVVTLSLLWWVALAPALQVMRTAPEAHRALDAQLQQMQALQGEAEALLARPALGRDQVFQALQTSVTRTLGSGAQLQVNGDNATLVLRAVPAASLARWLGEARENARVLPSQARLQRTPGQPATAAATWDGTLLLALPTER
ncbi:MAG: type II secretion system protein M [Comamonadaceae bacterium]|nr:MAG: type II secretion system protein M [Comamonadaceae bacterium]